MRLLIVWTGVFFGCGLLVAEVKNKDLPALNFTVTYMSLSNDGTVLKQELLFYDRELECFHGCLCRSHGANYSMSLNYVDFSVKRVQLSADDSHLETSPKSSSYGTKECKLEMPPSGYNVSTLSCANVSESATECNVTSGAKCRVFSLTLNNSTICSSGCADFLWHSSQTVVLTGDPASSLLKSGSCASDVSINTTQEAVATDTPASVPAVATDTDTVDVTTDSVGTETSIKVTNGGTENDFVDENTNTVSTGVIAAVVVSSILFIFCLVTVTVASVTWCLRKHTNSPDNSKPSILLGCFRKINPRQKEEGNVFESDHCDVNENGSSESGEDDCCSTDIIILDHENQTSTHTVPTFKSENRHADKEQEIDECMPYSQSYSAASENANNSANELKAVAPIHATVCENLKSLVTVTVDVYATVCKNKSTATDTVPPDEHVYDETQ